MSEDSEHINPAGVEHTGVIDLMLHDPRENSVTLVIVERRPWDGSPKRLWELQEKLNAYMSFALDGEMLDTYPQLAGVPLQLRVDCVSEPDPQTTAMLSIVKKQIGFQGIGFELGVHGEPGCGHGCGCAE